MDNWAWILIALIIALSLMAYAFINNYKIFGIGGLIGTVFILYIMGAYILGLGWYFILGQLAIVAVIGFGYLAIRDKIELKKIYFKDLKRKNDTKQSFMDWKIVFMSFCLFSFLIAGILILSPQINQYIQYLENSSNDGEIINSAATSVIIATTLSLAFFTPVFSFILSTIKENKKEGNKDQLKI